MQARRTLKFLAALLAAYALVVILAYLGPASLPEFIGYFVLVPLLSLYFFHQLGIPGLLAHNGACGLGMCSPTAFGWAFLAVFWIAVAWAIAWVLARIRRADGKIDQP